jgi:hypothetical protein
MDKLPTDAVVAIDRAGISPGDAMAQGADARWMSSPGFSRS